MPAFMAYMCACVRRLYACSYMYIYFLITYLSGPFGSVCMHWNLWHLRPVVPAIAVVAVAIPAVPAVDSLVTYSNMRFIMSTLGHCSSDAGHIISFFCCFSATYLIFFFFLALCGAFGFDIFVILTISPV